MARRWRGIGVALVSSGVAWCLLVAGPSPAPAGLEEMYARLPRLEQRCDDPVAGQWVGHAIYGGERYRLRLSIQRSSPGEPGLEGEITSEFWTMESDAPEPCGPEDGHRHGIIAMPALGEAPGEEVTLIGQSWRRVAQPCGEASSYVPDAIHGRLEGEDTLQARWFGAPEPASTWAELEAMPGRFEATPMRFQRVACGPRTAEVPPLPPPAPPAEAPSGCGCGGLF